MKTIKWFATVILSMTVCAATLAYADSYAPVDFSKDAAVPSEEVMDEGVSINGVDVSKKTVRQAWAAVRIENLKSLKKSLTITMGDKSAQATWADLGASYNEEGIFAEALRLGKGSGLIERYKTTADKTAIGGNIIMDIDVDEACLNKYITETLACLDGAPTDAKIERKNGEFIITPSVDGTKVNVSETFKLISTAIKEGRLSAGKIEAAAEFSRAHITEDMLSEIKDVLGTCKTYVDGTDNRANNVAVGSRNINGTILLPGESASVSALLLPRIAENGYKLAPQYKDGNSEDVYGGGICQVSSTLYNALLAAEIQIDERNPHSMKVSYLDPSRDAAISEGYKDLKFTNNLDYPIYIEGSSIDRVCVFTVYGREYRDPGHKVTYESVVTYMEQHPDIIVEVPTEPVGYSRLEGGGRHPETKSYLLKTVYENGEKVSSEILYHDHYMGSVKTNYIGTKPIEEPTEPTEDPEGPGGNWPFGR